MTCENFIAELNEIQNQYNAEQERKDQFNIFRALHKEHDEKFLHSRFISYLLSPTSKHHMGDAFLKAFIEVLSVEYPDLKRFAIKDCKVRPNEDKKSEYEDIDILVENGQQQAIVIENKIYAKDQTDSREDTDNQIQIKRYCNIIKKKGAQEIFAIYLTLDRHEPERVDEIKKDYPRFFTIDYHKEIQNWLDYCIEVTDNQLLKEILTQYQTVVLDLTSNLDRSGSFRKLISSNIDLAWENRERIMNMGDFKHVKWHTVFDFWNELSHELQKLGNNIPKGNTITIKEITKVTHGDKSGNTDKKPHGISFRMPSGREWYIMNDSLHGLTYGNPLIELNKRKQNRDWFTINAKIRFSEFDNQDTFELIDPGKRKNLIKQVINSITD